MYWLSIHMRIFKSFRLFHLTITECFDSILALLFKHCVFNHMSYLNAWNYLFPFIYQSLFRSLSLKKRPNEFFFHFISSLHSMLIFLRYILCHDACIHYLFPCYKNLFRSFHLTNNQNVFFFQLYFELSLFMHNVFQIYFIS